MPRGGPEPYNPAHPERVYPERSRREGHVRSRRGGKRPGAGAPRGNTNAVKTGRYSVRLRAIAKALGEVPEIRDLLLEAERRQHREQRKAHRLAMRALHDIASRIPDENNPLLPYLISSLPDSTFRQN